jgi:hypothetical protein
MRVEWKRRLRMSLLHLQETWRDKSRDRQAPKLPQPIIHAASSTNLEDFSAPCFDEDCPAHLRLESE